MSGGYSPPEERCPYCGEVAEADWVDVGVGLAQCGPYHCYACGATECGAYDDSPDDRARRDPRTGWFPPGDPPGSSANMLGGELATAAETRAAYSARFAPDAHGRTDYDEPGATEAWFAAQREPRR